MLKDKDLKNFIKSHRKGFHFASISPIFTMSSSYNKRRHHRQPRNRYETRKSFPFLYTNPISFRMLGCKEKTIFLLNSFFVCLLMHVILSARSFSHQEIQFLFLYFKLFFQISQNIEFTLIRFQRCWYRFAI